MRIHRLPLVLLALFGCLAVGQHTQHTQHTEGGKAVGVATSGSPKKDHEEAGTSGGSGSGKPESEGKQPPGKSGEKKPPSKHEEHPGTNKGKGGSGLPVSKKQQQHDDHPKPTPKPRRKTNGAKSGIALKGKDLYVDGEPYFMKGVAYSPVPLGDDPLYGAPYGDYFTDEYSAFWVRDLPLLRAMGANTIRTYSWNTSRNHETFLDMVHENDLKVCITYFLGSTQQTPIKSEADMERVAQDFAHAVGRFRDHPAILGWTFGNEINGGWNGFVYAIDGIYSCGWNPLPVAQGGCTNFDFKNHTSPCVNSTKCLYTHLFKWIDRAAELAHDALGEDYYRLVFATFADIDNLYQRIQMLGDDAQPNVDMWAAQIYRGKNFGEGEQNFWRQIKDYSDKPLAITEYGVDAYFDSCGICNETVCETPCYNSYTNETKGYGENQNIHAEWVASLTGQLREAYDRGMGVLGGFVMAWIDEAWKTTTHFPTNICADNTKKGKNGGREYHYPHAKFDPKTCDFKAHVSCPNLDIWKPSLCGQYMPAFPDHYLNEGFFGINKVFGVDGTDVNQLEPRLLYAVLQDMWLPKIDPIIEWHKAAMATIITATISTVLITIWGCQRHFQGRVGLRGSVRPSSTIF